MNKRKSTQQINQLRLFFDPSTNYIHYFETYTSCSHTRKTHLQHNQITKTTYKCSNVRILIISDVKIIIIKR